MIIARTSKLNTTQILVSLEQDGRRITPDDLTTATLEDLYSDDSITLSELQNSRSRVVGYLITLSNPQPTLIHVDSWWAAIFFRKEGVIYDAGREIVASVENTLISFHRHGKEKDADYFLAVRSPPHEERKSDCRFWTIPEPHPIEKE